ncbi:META domain-containing protein [Stappia sp. ES.058]|uniref:META domain-containing protein n=1 Tax=Stappia sp. ES.058 TaxID=1881061 RepID=UPI0012FD95DD|nr:META domain-containing protein [Stappia sp. ES.058]
MTLAGHRAIAFRLFVVLLAILGMGGALSAQGDKPSIAGEWQIAALATANGALVDLDAALVRKTEVVIDRHGLWAASAGCNRLRGTLEQSGRALSVSERVMATKMACAGPSGDLEQRFLRYFPRAVEVDGMDKRLLLRDAGGAVVVLLVGKD